MSERIIHETVTKGYREDEIVALCEAGRYREAAAALDGSDPQLYPLAFGMVETARGNQEIAKDYLFQAIQKGSGDKAKIQLACAYWRAGECKEALAILGELPDSFECLLQRAIILSEIDAGEALALLDKAAAFPMADRLQGSFHNQRAMLLRKLGETDRAIQEYDAAIHYFEGAKSDCVPVVLNNLAGIFTDCGEHAKAHSYIDRAIALLTREPDHLAKAYDQKALIFFREGRLEPAERYARMAVREAEPGDRKAWLAECLITHSKILLAKGDFAKALIQADRAEEIGRFLNNDQIVFEVCPVKKDIGENVSKIAGRLRIETALRLSNDNIRAAAKRLNVSHVALLKSMERIGLRTKNQH